MSQGSDGSGGPVNWYESSHIKEAVSHESIGNLGATRSKWQQRVDQNQNSVPPTIQSVRASAYPSAPQVNGVYGKAQTTDYSQYNGAQVRPEMHRHLNPIEQEIEEYKMREAELKHRSTSLPPPVGKLRPAGGHYYDYAEEYDRKSDLDREQELLLCYLKQHPEVPNAVGLPIPSYVRQKLYTLSPVAPRVELCEMMDQGYVERPVAKPPQRFVNDLLLNGYGSSQSSQSTLERPPNRGRYIKNTQPSQRKIPRKPSLESRRPWRNSDAVSPTPLIEKAKPVLFDDGYISPGESLIAKEIREAQDREEELNRSRSELGLPTLQDVMECWRMGVPSPGFGMSMRNAHSYDHLQWAVDQEQREPSLGFKAGSLDRLHQSYFAEEESSDAAPPSDRFVPVRSTEYRPSVVQDIQFSVQREESFKRRQQQELPKKSSASEIVATNPKTVFISKSASINGTGDKSPYEKFLATHHPNKSVSSFPVTSEAHKSTSFPVEARIEQEVQDIKRRESELRTHRENGVYGTQNITPMGLQLHTDSDQSEESGEREFRHSDYPSPMHYQHQENNADEMRLAPSGRKVTIGTIWDGL